MSCTAPAAPLGYTLMNGTGVEPKYVVRRIDKPAFTESRSKAWCFTSAGAARRYSEKHRLERKGFAVVRFSR